MMHPERAEERSSSRTIPLPVVVIRELCLVARRAGALYVSNDWEFVRRSLTEQSRTEAAQALRTVALLALTMAESLETTSSKSGRREDEEPHTNYGVQR
jgi:hypothetical protein